MKVFERALERKIPELGGADAMQLGCMSGRKSASYISHKLVFCSFVTILFHIRQCISNVYGKKPIFKLNENLQLGKYFFSILTDDFKKAIKVNSSHYKSVVKAL